MEDLVAWSGGGYSRPSRDARVTLPIGDLARVIGPCISLFDHLRARVATLKWLPGSSRSGGPTLPVAARLNYPNSNETGVVEHEQPGPTTVRATIRPYGVLFSYLV